MMQQRRLAMTGKLSEQGLHRLLTLLARDGEQALIVGGAVRNSLLGLPIDDIDIATSLEPKDVIDRLTNAGIRTIPTGLDHGTVTVLIGDYKYEVTTFREDIETDGRHATVRFGRDMQRDAERRDFTINALYADASGVVFDPVGGMEDLIARRVREKGVYSALLPGVPTFEEVGFGKFALDAWFVLMMPARTPPEIVARVDRAVQEIVSDPAVIDRLHAISFEPRRMAGPDVKAFVKSEIEKWGRVIKAAGLRAE